MQVWPSTDDFAKGADQDYGTEKVLGYIGIVPWSTGTDWVKECTPVSFGGGCVLLPNPGHADFGDGACAVMRRQVFPQNCTVRSICRIQAYGSVEPVVATDFVRHAVFARMSDTASVAAGTTPLWDHHLHVSGYMLSVRPGVAAGSLIVELSRLDAGVETVLATETGLSAEVNNYFNDVLLELKVTTSGSDVILVGSISGVIPATIGGQPQQSNFLAGGSGGLTVSGLPSGGPSVGVGTNFGQYTPNVGRPKFRGNIPAPPNDPFEVISHTDSAPGVKFTRAGRCGLGSGRPVVVTPVIEKNMHLISSFEVEDNTAGASNLVWRDEWQRTAPQLSVQVINFEVSGKALSSDYSSDGASTEVASVQIKRAASTDSVEAPASIVNGRSVRLDSAIAAIHQDHVLRLFQPIGIYGLLNDPLTIGITIIAWINVTAGKLTGVHTIYDSVPFGTPSGGWDGFRFGVEEVGGSARLFLEIGGDAAQTFTVLRLQSDTFGKALVEGTTRCVAVTYKANAAPGAGTGRVRFFYGRFGDSTQVGSDHIVPSTWRPNWWTGGPHVIAAESQSGALYTNRYFGNIDNVSVLFQEAPVSSMDLIMDDLAIFATLLNMDLAMHVNFEERNDDIGPSEESAFFKIQHAIATGGSPGYIAGKAWKDATDEAGSPPVAVIPWVNEEGLVPPDKTVVNWHQRPLAGGELHARRITATFGASANFSVAGIALRGTPASTHYAYTAYRLDVRPGTPAPIRIYRVIQGVETLIAREEVGSSINVSLSVAVKIEFQVENEGGVAGPVTLTAEIDDVTVDWQLVSNSGSVGLAAGGQKVRDTDNDRIQSGGAWGFTSRTSTANNTLLDDWGTGVTGVDPTPDATFPNPVGIQAEGDNAFGDIQTVLDPDWTVGVVHKSRRSGIAMDSGHAQGWALETYLRRRFSLTKLMSIAGTEYADLAAFHDDHDGPHRGFTFDPSVFMDGQVEQSGTFYFMTDELSIVRDGQKYRVSFELGERRAS